VTPFVPLLAGLCALGAGWLLLASFGPRFRVGRLLATTPRLSVSDAIELARSGERRYVRVDGRIDSDSEFEGAAHEPLVLRLTRFQARRRASWRTYDLAREAVPFVVNEGLASIGVDGSALDGGLVVVPRVAVGTASEAGDRAPSDAAPATAVRVVVEQVSSVEHAIVLGVPIVDATGPVVLSAGLGRPLVLTTLEPPEAMRILTGGAIGRTRLAALLIGLGLVLIAIAAAWWLLLVLPAAAAAASPDPTRGPGNDPRSAGEGPGLVGPPGLAIVAVRGIGRLAIVATLGYVRLTSPRQPPR
jgi:hypothetical protein